VETIYAFAKDFAAPGATIVAAFVAALITFRFGARQVDIAREQAINAQRQVNLAAVRLQHDLYDRRFRVFEVARQFLVNDIYDKVILSGDALFKFTRGVLEAEFLFDDEVISYLTDLRNRAVNLYALNSKFKDERLDQEARAKLADEEADLVNWFVDQYPILIKKFKPFLRLPTDHIKRVDLQRNKDGFQAISDK